MKTIRKGKIGANNNILSLNIFNCEGGIITAVTLTVKHIWQEMNG